MDNSKRKVLIVEDNKDLQKIYQYAFENANYEVMLSSDGLQGINSAIDFQPDVVLLDIMMPEMNGYQFIDALNNNTSMKIPIAIITNLNQEQERQKALNSGVDLFLTKAEYDGPDIVKKIDELLDSKNNKAEERVW